MSDKRPDWWPENPYPESVFTMTEEEYIEVIPDKHLRTRISGFMARFGWDRADEAIYEAWVEDTTSPTAEVSSDADVRVHDIPVTDAP